MIIWIQYNNFRVITLLNTYYLFNGPSEYNSQMLRKLSLMLNFLSIWVQESTEQALGDESSYILH